MRHMAPPEDALDPTGGARIAELESTLAQLREDSEVAYVLLGLSGAFAEVRPVEETLALAVRMIPELFGADRCFAARWEDASARFEILASSGFEAGHAADEMLKRAEQGAEGYPWLRQSLIERQPILMTGTDGDESVICIPLVRWGRDFGGLRLEFHSDRSFGSKDGALARAVARLLGVALHTARRFNLLQRLRGFGTRVGSLLKLGDVIQQVTDGAVELFSADGA